LAEGCDPLRVMLIVCEPSLEATGGAPDPEAALAWFACVEASRKSEMIVAANSFISVLLPHSHDYIDLNSEITPITSLLFSADCLLPASPIWSTDYWSLIIDYLFMSFFTISDCLEASHGKLVLS
jgi:hypothetical protein